MLAFKAFDFMIKQIAEIFNFWQRESIETFGLHKSSDIDLLTTGVAEISTFRLYESLKLTILITQIVESTDFITNRVAETNSPKGQSSRGELWRFSR